MRALKYMHNALVGPRCIVTGTNADGEVDKGTRQSDKDTRPSAGLRGQASIGPKSVEHALRRRLLKRDLVDAGEEGVFAFVAVLFQDGHDLLRRAHALDLLAVK